MMSLSSAAVASVRARGIASAQAALARLLWHERVIAIPKTSHPDRVADNAGALDVTLSEADHRELDRLFAAPGQAQPLRFY